MTDSMPMPDQSQGLTVDADHGLLYVASDDFSDNPPGNLVLTPGTVTVIDEWTNKILHTITTGPADPPGSEKAVAELVALDPVTRTAYASNFSVGNVVVIDQRTNKVTDIVTTGGGNYGIGVDPFRRKVYVANALNNNVAVISAGGPAPWKCRGGPLLRLFCPTTFYMPPVDGWPSWRWLDAVSPTFLRPDEPETDRDR